MVWPPAILGVAGVASVVLGIPAAYAAAPSFKAYLRRRDPSIDVPHFDFHEARAAHRLAWLMWTTRISRDQPRLRRRVLAFRILHVCGPVLMIASLVYAIVLDRRDEGSVQREPHAPPPVTITISPSGESAR